MNNILTINGSNSSVSIHLELINILINKYNAPIDLLPIRENQIQLYDRDVNVEGIPAEITMIFNAIKDRKTLLITSPEHNGFFTSYLKAILDWLSRVEMKFLADKKIFILGTSSGRGGAAGSIDSLSQLVKRLGATEVVSLSIPSWGHISNEEGDFIPEVDEKIKHFISQF